MERQCTFATRANWPASPPCVPAPRALGHTFDPPGLLSRFLAPISVLSLSLSLCVPLPLPVSLRLSP
eukprot:scaffold71032_cov36-Tisochrysis_lutea.AAC.1